MTLHSEIFEQPERIASLLGHQKQTVIEIANAIRTRNVQYAFLAARGAAILRPRSHRYARISALPASLPGDAAHSRETRDHYWKGH